MIVVMRIDSGDEQSAGVLQRIESFGLQGEVIHGEQRKVIAVLGQVFPDLRDELATMDGVDQVLRVSRPYKLASREVPRERHRRRSRIRGQRRGPGGRS